MVESEGGLSYTDAAPYYDKVDFHLRITDVTAMNQCFRER